MELLFLQGRGCVLAASYRHVSTHETSEYCYEILWHQFALRSRPATASARSSNAASTADLGSQMTKARIRLPGTGRIQRRRQYGKRYLASSVGRNIQQAIVVV